MKDLVWDNILSVGVEEIDDDHRKLINIFNILNHSVMEGAAADYVGAVFEELINCTVWHFSHEERLMLKYGYEGTEEHKTEHQDLINSVKELQQKFFQVGKLAEKEDLEFLEHWLTEHILGADIKLGSYLIDTM
ncbi:MAG: bacteriohemerythrin [Pseudomonadota bacterium]|nr:bacteriohemerythrin [Pseudomonadota bacterium]